MGKDQELLEAARGGQPAVVERLLQQRARRSGPLASLRRGPGANIQDSSGYTPLHHAAVNGHKDIIKLLLAADASPSVVDQNGLTPLHLAAWGGYTDIVKSLLAHNVNPVNVDLATKTKETALHFAAHFGHVEVVSQLLMRGADPYLKNDKDETPLDLAAQYGRLDTVQHLLRMRPDLVQMYRAPMSRARIFTVTPLHLASRNGQNQVVAVLLAAGVDVNIRTEEGGTALHEAALHGKEDVVRTLLDRGIDLNLQDGKGMTVQQLLRNYKAPALLKIREIIESHRPHNGFGSDCEEYWPPIPNDRSPSYGDPCGRYSSDVEQDMERLNSLQPPKTPQVNDNFINNPSSSVTIKQHSNNFVKKITSKCLGLKAKFNSAPNISNSGDSAEVELRSKPNYLTSNRTKVTNTLHIGNSKFFKILAKKKEQPIDVICNDEFDTISLDRLVTMDRLSVYNRSNRSCPGFKISLPNISENTELSSDSSESILPDHVRDGNDNVLEAYNLDLRSSLSFAKLVVPKENHNLMVINARNSLKSVDETNELYECYESASNNILNSIEHKITKSENPDEIIKPPRRSIVAHNISNTIYENVPFENRAQTPKPPARTPHKILHETSIVASLEEPIYVNLTKPDLLNLSQPLPAKRTNLPTKNHETIPSLDSCTNEVSDSPTQSSRTSTMSLDSKIDYSNFEDILLSKKSKSFRTAGHITVYAQSLNNDDSDISSETSSVLSEFNTIEDVDCSLEQEKTDGDYVIMSRTLPKVTANDTSDTKRGLFRNVTFSNASPSLNKPDRKCTKSHLVNYHIRGTGHCIYKAPTVQEFIYVFNRDTLTQDDVHPFSKVPNNRDSYFETAICFCKPNELKHHKSADDLLAIPSDDNGPNVYIDTESLFKRVAIEASSFRCYCDDGSCSLHHKKHQSSSFAVKFHAFNRSVSTPDLLAAKVDPVLTAKATHLEEPYAVVDLSGIRFRQTYSTSSDDTSLTFGALSEPSTLSSTLRRPNSSDFQSESNSVSSDGTLRSEVGTLGVASLDGGSRAGRGCVRSGSDSRVRRWDEGDVLSEADALSVSSAASSSAPHHLMHRHHHRHHHHGYNKVSPTPPKKPPRRNLSVSPTHPNSPAASYDQLRTHARSQDDLDDLQGAKHYLKHGRSIDQYVDGKHSYPEYSEESQNSPRIIPIPNPRPSLKNRNQPVAITAMYENVVIKEQNPRRKLRRNFTHQYENFDPAKMATRRYSTQERSSLESLLDDVRSVNSPSDCERYCDGVKVPLSPTHYDQPPTPEHPPPSAKQAEKSIHERIRPLSQEYKRRSCALRDSQTETESSLLRAASAASVASGATDRSAKSDNCVEEYVCDVPFAGLFKGSTTQLDGIGLRPVPAERPKTLRKLKSVYDSSPTDPERTLVSSNGHSERDDDVVRRRSNTSSSNHSADKSLSILSPFDEQEEWAKISEIMASFGSKLVRESVFVSELEQEFTSRLGLSCSESSLSASVVSTVGHWLNGLGLADYESLFIECGFDEVDFINGIIDENDLRDMGIDETDRAKILEAVNQLPHKIAEISTNHSNNFNNNNISKPNDQIESVEEWLKNISLEQYSDTFRKHLYVDMDRVRRIWEVELTAVLEIQKPGHRKRILASVSGQHNGPANHVDDINADLKTLKNNIQHLKEEIKEKLPSDHPLPPPKPVHHPGLAPPGGETLKRSKKNRPAPQPPKPSDLEIRAPSELLVGVPGALKTQWRHQPFVLVSGAVTYVANYLGSTVVKELRGTESTKKSIQKLKKSTKEPRDSPDIILSISYRGVKFLNTITRDLVCEHEIRNIHCACQDADDLTHFAYITKDHGTKSHYCHVFCVATMDQATEVILTLGEAFEVAYQMALREQFTKNSTNRIIHNNSGPQQAKTPTHDPMTFCTTKEKPNLNHGRSHSITEIKLNGHQLKIAPVPASLSNEDFQLTAKSDGSRSPRTPLLKAPIASTEEL